MVPTLSHNVATIGHVWSQEELRSVPSLEHWWEKRTEMRWVPL